MAKKSVASLQKGGGKQQEGGKGEGEAEREMHRDGQGGGLQQEVLQGRVEVDPRRAAVDDG